MLFFSELRCCESGAFIRAVKTRSTSRPLTLLFAELHGEAIELSVETGVLSCAQKALLLYKLIGLMADRYDAFDHTVGFSLGDLAGFSRSTDVRAKNVGSNRDVGLSGVRDLSACFSHQLALGFDVAAW